MEVKERKSRAGRPWNKWTEKEEKILIELYDDGWTNKEIGLYLGRSESAVGQHLTTVLNMKRTKKTIGANISKGQKNRYEKLSEMPVERPESQNEALYDEKQEKVRTEDETPLLSLLQISKNSGLEQALYDVIFRATYDAMKKALNE